MRLSFLFAMVVAAGCGSVSAEKTDAGSHDGPPGADFTLTVAPDSVNIPIASSMNVTVTVTRTAGLGDITLAANNLPANIMVAFATNPLPEGTDTTDATISVVGGSAAGTSTITILGTAGTKEHSATLSVTAQTITVTGKTAANATVHMVGKAAVTADSSGNFTYTDVTPPYDIYTFSTSFLGAVPTIIYYDDLTRVDPVLATAGGFFVFPIGSSGTIQGTKSGPGTLNNPNIVAFSDGGTGTFTSGTFNYSFTGSWAGNQSPHAGTVYGLQWSTRATGAPLAIQGYGSTAANITAGITNTVNLTFAAPSAAGLVGSITPPAGFSNPPAVTLSQQLGNVSVQLWQGNTTDATATIPVIAAGKSSLYASATTGSGNTTMTSSMVYPALNAATDVTFALVAPATQVVPLNGATNVDTTIPFEITAPTGAVYSFGMYSTGATKASFQIISTATTVKIPNVPELPVPSNMPFNWSVSGYGPMMKSDDAAGPSGLNYVGVAEYAGTRHFQTGSQVRTFTSKP